MAHRASLVMGGPQGWSQQETAQFLRHLVVTQGFGPLLGHDHQVPGGQPTLMTPEKFPQQALHAVAPDRLAEAPGHHQSQAGTQPLRRRQGDPEMTRVYPSPLGLDPEKFRATAETVRFGEAGGPCDGWSRDGGGAPVDGVRGRTQGYSTAQTVRRLRPLARRRLMTWRPPRVLIRSRKPWVLDRRKLCG